MKINELSGFMSFQPPPKTKLDTLEQLLKEKCLLLKILVFLSFQISKIYKPTKSSENNHEFPSWRHVSHQTEVREHRYHQVEQCKSPTNEELDAKDCCKSHTPKTRWNYILEEPDYTLLVSC